MHRLQTWAQQELSYRKQIAHQLRTQFVEGISVRPWPWKSLKVTGNGTIGQIIHDLLLDELFDVIYYRDLKRWVRGQLRSLKLVSFESLDAVSYTLSIVTMAVSVAVCEIFNVKRWRDLQNQVRGHSRSLKMVPFDRPYGTFYWSAVVNIALSCTIFEFFHHHHHIQF